MNLRNLLAAAVVAGLGAGAAPAAADLGGDFGLHDVEPTATLTVAHAESWYRPCRVWPITWQPYNGVPGVWGHHGRMDSRALTPPFHLLRRPCFQPPFPYLPLVG